VETQPLLFYVRIDETCADLAALLWKEVNFMNELMARTPKQLDICLRLLYAEHVKFSVRVVETEKRKIAYLVRAEADEATIEVLREKYRILTT